MACGSSISVALDDEHTSSARRPSCRARALLDRPFGRKGAAVKLTASMRAALQQARHAPLRRVLEPGPGAPAWPAHPGTLHALERHKLLTRGEIRNRHGQPVTTWTITTAGRQALEPPEIFRRERDVYLAHPNPDLSGDYTTDPRRSRDELPVLDPDSLNNAWAQISAERRASAETPRDRARRLARNARAA